MSMDEATKKVVEKASYLEKLRMHGVNLKVYKQWREASSEPEDHQQGPVKS